MFSRWIRLRGKKSVLLLGPRRVGKSTLLKSLFHGSYVTLDDLDALAWAKRDPKGFVLSLKSPAVIDEIQRYRDLFIAVKYAIDENNEIFAMSGSTAAGLYSKGVETLAGRIEIAHLPTCCWGEELGPPTHDIFREALSPPAIMSAQRKLEEALQFGGFPEVINQKTESEKSELLKNYRDTYFTRDLAMLANLENVDGLLAVLLHVGRSIGSFCEVSSMSQETGVSQPTIKKYLNVLYFTDLIIKLRGYHFGVSKRYIKAPKYYFSDSGMATALKLQLSRGQVIENFVIGEIEKRRKLGFIPSDELFYCKTVSGAEVDLVFETHKEIFAIEIKSSQKPGAKDIANLKGFSVKNKKKVLKFLFYAETEYQSLNGIRAIPIAALYRGH